jgi:putative IMPACT (imprinted ancient) family translation regulator
MEHVMKWRLKRIVRRVSLKREDIDLSVTEIGPVHHMGVTPTQALKKSITIGILAMIAIKKETQYIVSASLQVKTKIEHLCSSLGDVTIHTVKTNVIN